MGDRLFSLAFKPFVYDLFIAGETKEDISETMRAMEKRVGLKPLLSPMLEDDPSQEGAGQAKRYEAALILNGHIPFFPPFSEPWSTSPT